MTFDSLAVRHAAIGYSLHLYLSLLGNFYISHSSEISFISLHLYLSYFRPLIFTYFSSHSLKLLFPWNTFRTLSSTSHCNISIQTFRYKNDTKTIQKRVSISKSKNKQKNKFCESLDLSNRMKKKSFQPSNEDPYAIELTLKKTFNQITILD